MIQTCKNESRAVIVWVDFMKFGVLSKDDLNHVSNLLAKTLCAMPEKSIGFVIAPSGTSDRRSGLRDELRWALGKSHQYQLGGSTI